MAKNISQLSKLLKILDTYKEELTPVMIDLINKLYELFKVYDTQIKAYDQQLENLANQNDVCQEIQKIPGIGPLTASAIVAAIGDAKAFKNGRQVSAWLGLVPRRYSTWRKNNLGWN